MALIFISLNCPSIVLWILESAASLMDSLARLVKRANSWVRISSQEPANEMKTVHTQRKAKRPRTFPVVYSYVADLCWLCSPVQNNPLCVAKQRVRGNSLRKCGIVYGNKTIFMPTYRLHSIVQKID